MNFTYVSLFSGIGGFEQALNQLGGTCVLASEFDKYADNAYATLYGHHTAGDVTKIKTENVPDHDFLVGGFPCQAFSTAGKREGMKAVCGECEYEFSVEDYDVAQSIECPKCKGVATPKDERGLLFHQLARIAEAKQPKMMLLENVKGLVNHDGGRTLDIIIKKLDAIGYVTDFTVLNSKYFDVPQNRERWFCVAVRKDLIDTEVWRNVTGNTMIPKGKRRIQALGVKTFNFKWPEEVQVTKKLRDVLEPEVDPKYYLAEDKTAKLVAELESKDLVIGSVASHPFSKKFEFNGFNNADYTPAMIATDYKAPKCLLEAGLPIREATTQGYAIAREGDAVNIAFPSSKTRRGRVGEQMANTLEASGCNQGVVEREEVRPVITPDRVNKRQNGRRFKEDGEEAFTCTSIDRHGVAIGEYPQYRIRKLTPLECLRLQAFPDSVYHTLKDAGFSDSRIYKFAGNAVTVNVIKAIAKKMIEFMELDDRSEKTPVLFESQGIIYEQLCLV